MSASSSSEYCIGKISLLVTLTSSSPKTALDALAEKGLKVAIGHNRRFSPNAIRLKQMIDSGELGDMIQKLQGDGATVLMAESDVSRLHFVDKMYQIERGENFEGQVN